MRASSIKYRNVMSNPSQARSSAHLLSALSTRSSSSPQPVPFMSSRQPFRPPKPNARKEAANTPMPMKQNSNCHCPVSHSCGKGRDARAAARSPRPPRHSPPPRIQQPNNAQFSSPPCPRPPAKSPPARRPSTSSACWASTSSRTESAGRRGRRGTRSRGGPPRAADP